MNIAFPLDFDPLGRTASCGDEAHIRQMIELLLFTTPGERVNRPDFGCGLLRQVFEPNSPELAAALQFTVRAAIDRWLGDLVETGDLVIASDDSRINVDLSYRIRRTGEAGQASFERSLS
jgi:phage baseplate assembly protein W